MAQIPLFVGKEARWDAVALVDDEDYERVMQYKWRLHPSGYACTRGQLGDRTVYLHKFVMRRAGRHG